MTLFLIKREKGKKKDGQNMLSVELYLRFRIKSLVIDTNIELILYTFFSGVFVMSHVG